MGRGKLSQETKIKRELARIAEIFGDAIDLTPPPESTSDLMRTAQSVINYFDTDTRGYKEKPCKQCERVFAYKWDSTAIAYCSIMCAKEALKERGIEWDPNKPPSERWGKTAPLVVPPEVLDILKDQDETLKDHSHDTVTSKS